MCGMSVFNGTMLATLAGGFVVWSLGPNVVVGVPGAIWTGGQATCDRVKLAWERSRLDECQDDGEREEIIKNIKELKKSEDSHWAWSRFWAKSSIPLIGPMVACSTT